MPDSINRFNLLSTFDMEGSQHSWMPQHI